MINKTLCRSKTVRGKQCQKKALYPLKNPIYCQYHKHALSGGGLTPPTVQSPLLKFPRPVNPERMFEPQPLSPTLLRQMRSMTPVIRKPVSSRNPKKIGSGSYGCVYRPPLLCLNDSYLDEKYKNDVMKVMSVENAAVEEMIAAEIRNLDPDQQYFLPLTGDACQVRDPQHLIETKCNIYKEGYLTTDFEGYFIPYGGETLEHPSSKQMSIHDLLELVVHLLNGLNLLHSAKIYHLDIKSQNVVINDHDKLPKLIDFGIARTPDNLLIAGPYDKYPLFYNVMSVHEARDLYDFHEKQVSEYYPAYVKGSGTDLISETIWAMKRNSIKYLKDVIVPNLDKVDIYMLFSMISDDVLKPNYETFLKEDKESTKLLKNLCRNCTHPDYHLQYSMLDIVDYLHRFFK